MLRTRTVHIPCKKDVCQTSSDAVKFLVKDVKPFCENFEAVVEVKVKGTKSRLDC